MTEPLRWGAYLRISDDPHDTQRGVSRQREDAGATIERLGGDPGSAVWYVENDTSAWKKRKVTLKDLQGREYVGYRVIRPLWHDALHDLRSGKINALCVYDLDRLARDPRDLEDAIEVVEHYGAKLVSATATELDLGTESGRLGARISVMIANKSSADTARRVRRAHLASAQEGKAVGGRRPFGYNDDKVTIRESEAALIREAVADVLAGDKLATVADRWNAAGVRTVSGVSWTPGLVLQMLRSPRIAGWRIHRPTGTKWTPVPPVAVDKEGNPVRGQWEPIIDDATHRQLVALLTNRPERRSRVPRKGAARYLMTGLLRCAKCSGAMYGNAVGDGRYSYYRCDTVGCSNSASATGVDAWVGERVVARSELVESNAAPTGPATPSDRLRELNQQIDDVAEMVEDIMAAYRQKQIPARVAFANVSELEEARDAAVAERDALEAELAGTGAEPVTAETWEAMDLDRRRAAVARVLDAVYVNPATRRGNKFDTTRLDPVWKA